MAVIPVFVSSTFRDFHGERDVLAEGVRERLDEQIRDLGCRVEIIDLRWGVDTVGVDADEAARRVVDVCLQQVERAQPLFVGLIGDRVGYIPDPAHVRWVADRAKVPATQHVEGLSVTELEFGFGMLWPSAPAGEHIVVFRDLEGPAPDGWVDPDRQRIADFREQVTARAQEVGAWALSYRTVVDPGTEIAELSEVTAGSTRTSFEDLMVEALSGPIRRRAELVIRGSGTGWEGAERLFRDDHQVAVGREALIGQLAATTRGGGRTVLVGDSGTGKSTIVCAVEDELRATPGVTVVSALLGASATGVSGRDIALHLAAQFVPFLGHEIAPPSTADEDEFIQWWTELLAEAASVVDGRLVIVMDALDAMSDDRAHSDVWPARTIPSTIAVLCSTTEPAQAEVLVDSGAEQIHIGDLPAPIAAEAAREWAAKSGRTLPASVIAVIGSADRSPLWIRLAVDLLADLDGDDFARIAGAEDQAAAIEQLLLTEATSLPSATPELAGVFLNRVAERVGAVPANILLGALATARSGLAPADLARLLAGDRDAPRKVAVLQRVLGGQLRSTDTAGRLTFAHAAVEQHAQTRAVPDIHHRLVTILAADEAWDDADALDAIWHTIHATAEISDGGAPLEVLASQLTRAANHRPPGGELALMRALDMHPHTGIPLLDDLDGSVLTVAGIELFLSAGESIDLRHVGPRDRVELGRAVVSLARQRGDGSDRALFWALSNSGNDSKRIGDLDTAQHTFEESLDLARRLAKAQPGSVEALRDVSVSLNNVGQLQRARGDLDTAQHTFEEQLTSLRSLAKAQPGSVEALRDVSVSLDNVGQLQRARGDLDTAQHTFEESLDLRRHLAEAQPGSVQALRDVFVSLANIGAVEESRRDLMASNEHFTEAVDLARTLYRVQPGSAETKGNLRFALSRLADVKDQLGNAVDAAEIRAEARALE